MRALWSAADRCWLRVPPVGKESASRFPLPPLTGRRRSTMARPVPVRGNSRAGWLCEPRASFLNSVSNVTVRAALGLQGGGVGGAVIMGRRVLSYLHAHDRPEDTRTTREALASGSGWPQVTLAPRIQHHALVIGHSLSARRRTAGHAGLARTRASDHAYASLCNRCYQSIICNHMQPDGAGCRAAGGGARRGCGGAAGDWPGGSPPRDGAREKARGGVAYRDKEEWRTRSAPAADPEPESDTDPVYPQLRAGARDGHTRRTAAPVGHDAAARSGAVKAARLGDDARR